MSLSDSILRLSEYFRRHGLRATFKRALLTGKRTLLADRMVVLYCDLDERKLPQVNIPESLRVLRLRTLPELSPEHLQAITSFWNPKLACRNIRERFEKGASLWLVESEKRLAGYGWTIEGQTIAPYYFPLGPDDVHLFDFLIFPRYRGLGINPLLVCQILDSLGANCAGRAFIEAAEWNDAQLSSLRKTPFSCLGSVQCFTILGRTFVSWIRSDMGVERHKVDQQTAQIATTTRSNEQ